METRRTRAGGAVQSIGGLLTAGLLDRVRADDRTVPGLDPEAYHLLKGERFGEATARSWTRLQTAWLTYRQQLAHLPENDTATTITRERFLLPLFDELGYGRLQVSRALTVEDRTYAISHGWNAVPIHLVGARVPLDRRSGGVRGAAGQSPHGLLQDYLNRADDALWGMVSNGLVLRLLRDNASLTRQSYVEFDLEAIFDGQLYADFVLLWLICHQSRLEGDRPESCFLEQWRQEASKAGTRALDRLRDGVEEAITTLGAGFLEHPANGALRDAVRSGELEARDYYRQLLRVVYRLIFLFVAEDRDALLHPDASEVARQRYHDHYSTAWLRELAVERRGSRHPDLWRVFQLVVRSLGSDTGAPSIGLPALGGFLFGPEATPALDGAELSNRNLLAAIRSLALIEDRGLRLPVDFRNLDSEELGSIYESLLAYHPEIHPDAPSFRLASAAGSERKTSGSYYTPTSLISVLLDSALDPVLAEAASKRTKEEAEQAILDLKVLDPAVGSGHFLVGAARRIARKLASVRMGDEEPPPAETQRALRDVVGRCLYGVDLNPDAAELCRVSLWLEAIQPGRPLSFLDAHIRVGNSLLGATADLVRAGLPDAAFEAIDGDDKRACTVLKARNRAESQSLGPLWAIADKREESELAAAVLDLGAMPEETVGQVARKSARFHEIEGSPELRRAARMADLWCAAFFSVKEFREQGRDTSAMGITQEHLRQVARDEPLAQPLETLLTDIATEYRFFHWHLAFPDVAVRGGFDCVLGNPPWDTMSPDAKEFFSRFDPEVRNATPSVQRELIDRLLEDPAIHAEWTAYCRHLYRAANFMRNSGRYRLFAPGNLGKGDFNVYRTFMELALTLTRLGGHASQVVPDGLYLGANATAIRQELVTAFDWKLLFGFENTREVWFKDIDSRSKFCIYAARKDGPTQSIDVAFGLTSEAKLDESRAQGGVSLPVSLLRELSPLTLAIPDVADLSTLMMVQKIGSAFPPFGQPVDGWPDRVYMAEVHMGNDRDLFNDRGDGYPLYEGRMVDQFDHRAKAYISGRGRTAVWLDLPFGNPQKSIRPQWFVAGAKIPSKVRGRMSKYRIGFCDVTSPTNERSLVAAILPPGVVAGHKVPTVDLAGGTASDYLYTIALMNSLAVDYVVRRKVALSMAYTIMDGLPIPRRAPHTPFSDEIIELSARLVCVAAELGDLWKQLVSEGCVTGSWEDAALQSPERRLATRARLDALIAVHLFGLGIGEMEQILADFRALQNRETREFSEFRTKRLLIAEVERELQRKAEGEQTRGPVAASGGR